MVAGVSAVFGGDADPVGSGRIPLHLLLLSRRVLQSLLGRSAAPARWASRARAIWGEKKFPLILQNVHRYFLYFAILFIFILSYDGIRALWFTAPDGSKHFGIGVGSLVLIVNPILLGCTRSAAIRSGIWSADGKTFCRHRPSRKTAYDCVSCLNRRHMLWAWISMFFVGFADLYVRLCDMGIWHDWRIF